VPGESIDVLKSAQLLQKVRLGAPDGPGARLLTTPSERRHTRVKSFWSSTILRHRLFRRVRGRSNLAQEVG
jgi:hypothetical protein